MTLTGGNQVRWAVGGGGEGDYDERKGNGVRGKGMVKK